MKALEGWRIAADRDEMEVQIVDPAGSVAARVEPAGPAWPKAWRALRLEGKLQSIEADMWAASFPSIPRHLRADIVLPDGQRTTIRNGTPTGPLRRADNVRLEISGRRYELAHTTGTTAEVLRDSTRLVVAWSGGRRRPAGAKRAAFKSIVELDVLEPTDHLDELAIVVLTGLCGMPGREGAVRRIASGLWSDATNA